MFTFPSLLLCATASSFAVEPHFSISSPWILEPNGPQEWTLEHEQHPAALRLNFKSEQLGLTLIHQNRMLHTVLDHQTIPLISPPFDANALTKIHVETQGIDLVIRLEGPTLQNWTGSDQAPLDPVISWTRVRVRGSGWRFIMKGLQTFTLPADSQGPHPTPTPKGGVEFSHGFGQWHYKTDAEATVGQKTHTHWYVDTSPAVHVFQPYPNTVVEWTP